MCRSPLPTSSFISRTQHALECSRRSPGMYGADVKKFRSAAGNSRIPSIVIITSKLRHGLSAVDYSPNSTCLVTSRRDRTRHVRRVEPMHFGCVEFVEQHGSTRSSRRAPHVERRVVTRRDMSQMEFGLLRV